MPHVFVIESIDGDTAIIRDTPARPFALSLSDLAAARKKLRVGKQRLLTIAPGKSPDWPDVFRDAIAACAAGLHGKTKIKGPMAKNFGLGGLRRWANALVDPKDPKAWSRVFPPAAAPAGLAWSRHWIEHAGTGGAAFRPMYADFLDVAAKVMSAPELGKLAREYRALANAWRAFAESLVEPFPEIRLAQDARHDAFRDGDLEAMHAAEAKVVAATRAARIDEAKLRAHYAALGGGLSVLIDGEEACAARLAAATQ